MPDDLRLFLTALFWVLAASVVWDVARVAFTHMR